MRRILSALFLALLVCSCSRQENPVMAGMVERLLPGKSGGFSFRIEAEPGRETDSSDYFILSSEGGKICITGNSNNSLAVGLNYYLRYFCDIEVSWYADDPIYVPEVLPIPVSPVRVDARASRRFFLNYCTFGYTMVWWQWKDWERFIDWMALNGVNMPLAITGQEEIWRRVWSRLGLSDEQILGYFTGPAHLPWHRMSNIDRWQGPLPLEWIEGQVALQKKILERERQFAMTPVLPAFAGHVPQELGGLYPQARIIEFPEWAGFGREYMSSFLDPTDSLFNVIQTEFLREQTKEFGTGHVYGIDPFNEIDPPSWKADSLAFFASEIYKSLAAVDPDAIWLQMGWLFYADPDHWTPENIQAYLSAVPEGRLLMLDYFCEFTELWMETDAFAGQPFLWCYLGNFGGNTMLSGNIKTFGERLEAVYEARPHNFEGVGSTLEGFGVSRFVYEYFLDKAWNHSVSDRQWMEALARRRSGSQDSAVLGAWETLWDQIFIQPTACGQATLTNAHPCLEGHWHWVTKPDVDYDYRMLLDVWEGLCTVPSVRDSHIYDIVNVGRQFLGDHFLTLRDGFAAAYSVGDLPSMEQASTAMLGLLEEMEKLLSFHGAFSLEKWLADARAMGKGAALSDYYEKNARTILTVWGDNKELNDYANRSWSGLTASFYAPRWKMFTEAVMRSARRGETFDQKAFDKEIYSFQEAWIEPKGGLSAEEKASLPEWAGIDASDVYELSQRLIDKYRAGFPD